MLTLNANGIWIVKRLPAVGWALVGRTSVNPALDLGITQQSTGSPSVQLRIEPKNGFAGGYFSTDVDGL